MRGCERWGNSIDWGAVHHVVRILCKCVQTQTPSEVTKVNTYLILGATRGMWIAFGRAAVIAAVSYVDMLSVGCVYQACACALDVGCPILDWGRA
jgi:hypothetical protein